MLNAWITNNSVVGGQTAKVIGTFDDFVKKRVNLHSYHSLNNAKQTVSVECENELWETFFRIHNIKC